jgi:hypothetical protein
MHVGTSWHGICKGYVHRSKDIMVLWTSEKAVPGTDGVTILYVPSA